MTRDLEGIKMDLIIYSIVGIILLVLAIHFWPVTLVIIGIYVFYRYQKKQAYEERSSQIDSLQSEVSRMNEDIKRSDSRKAEIRQTVTATQSELSQLRDGLSDMQRFQRFILAFTQNDCTYAIPRSIDVLTSQIASKEALITELESEAKNNDTTVSRLQKSIDFKKQEISSLQEQQAASEKKNR